MTDGVKIKKAASPSPGKWQVLNELSFNYCHEK